MQRPGARAAAAELLDAAIDEVKQHRQTLDELLQFLRDARKGILAEAGVPEPAHAHAELPHPGSVVLEPPGPEDDERALLLTAATATVDGCTEVVWARLQGRGDVLVVAADEPEHQAAVVQELSEALPASVFPDAVVVGRRADLVHPLIEQVVATGRRVSAL